MKQLFTFALAIMTFATVAQNARFPLSEPALSPDGREIAFVNSGDIWTVPSNGGDARILIAHPDYDSRPVYSPDGRFIAFMSTRSGNGDVYVFSLENGSLRRLTFDDVMDEPTSWSPDSKWIYFHSTGREIAGMNDVFKVALAGGTPIAVLQEPYTNEYFASPSPDGTALIFNARGIASRQWWRHGHSHLDESEIWMKKNDQLTKVTDRGAKHLWPMWVDAQTIWFISDKSGHENLWSQSLTTGALTQRTSFTDGRTLWASIGADRKSIVFEHDMSIWKMDVTSGKSGPVAITLRGAPASPEPTLVRVRDGFSNLALSPDSKKLVIIARGDVFAASAKDGGSASRVTFTPAPESAVVWSADSKSVIYCSSESGFRQLVQYTFASQQFRVLTKAPANHDQPTVSPNGKFIAYVRDGKELRTIELATGQDKLITKAFFGARIGSSSIEWSPDNQYIAYSAYGKKSFCNIFIVAAQGGAPRQVTNFANSFGRDLQWSKDGKFLLFLTSQRTEVSQIARIDLQPRTPQFIEERFQNLFSEPAMDKPIEKPVSKPPVKKDTTETKPVGESTKGKVSIAWDGIQQRVSFLPVGLDVNEIVLSNDGKTLAMVADVAGQDNIYTWSLDELAKEPPVAKQLTTSSGAKNSIQFSPDDKEVLFIERGQAQRAVLDNKQVKGIDLTAEVEVNFSIQKSAVFKQAWELQRDNFYDTAFHGTDWNAQAAKYEPWVLGARHPEEMRRVIGMMIGELNASHSGIGAPGSSLQEPTSRLGLKFDWKVYETTGSLRVVHVIPNGPADVAGLIKVGDYVVAIEDSVISARTNLDKLLLNKNGKRTSIKVSVSGSLKDAKNVYLKPIGVGAEKGLLYRDWVNQQRAYVNKISNGRIGYVHMFDMSSESLEQYHRDLDAENHAKEGVIVDIRNNNGGFVNAYALDVLSRKPYLSLTVRGLPTAPARTQLGQRSLELPTVLVINQHSLSDAEDFTEGYKTMQLGKVIGEPTSGWIIYTSNVTLVDGSSLRLPFIKVTDHEGKNMELAPRQPDIFVSRNLGETAAGKDSQLDAAVSELLKRFSQVTNKID